MYTRCLTGLLACLLFFLSMERVKAESPPFPRKKSVSSKPSPSVQIMDKGKKTERHLVHFVHRNNQGVDSVLLRRIIKAYLDECAREGVNHDVAVCQMCLETGFLKFDGTVSRYQNNFCGLGATGPYIQGEWFGTVELGVRAHIQHLKAYASLEPLRSPLVDPRFHRVIRGSVLTIWDLTGTWASDPGYGLKIDQLLRRLYGL